MTYNLAKLYTKNCLFTYFSNFRCYKFRWDKLWTMNSCSFFVFRESTQPHEGHRWVRSPLYRTPLNMIPPCAGDRYVESLCSGHRWVRIHPVQDTAELEFTLCRQDTAELEFTLCRNTAELHIESTLGRVQDTAELESKLYMTPLSYNTHCTWHRWVHPVQGIAC